MKKKIIIVLLAICLIAAMAVSLVACNQNLDGDIRFAAPQGTPALAMLRLKADNPNLCGATVNYDVVSPQNISLEMSSDKADVVIMPVNAGAKLINQGKDYKLISVAVQGSLYLVGKKDDGNEITIDDIKGKKIACIGQNDVPGLVFRSILAKNNISVITSGEPNANEVFINYVAGGPLAISAMQSGSVQYAVVGEPAATQMKGKLQLNAEMDLQKEYAKANNLSENYCFPQAGIFVKSKLANNKKFLNELFSALEKSKEWAVGHADEVEAFAKDNLYDAAVFPAASIARCKIDGARLTSDDQNKIIAFLKTVEPKDKDGNLIDWNAAASKIF